MNTMTVRAPILLKPIASGVSIAEALTVKVADCFRVGDGVFAYRDPGFDRWLPETVQAVGAGTASMFELAKELNFQEMVQAHIGITGSHDELKKALIEQRECYSPKQIDDLLRNCERGENPLKLQTYGGANLFFMQVGNDVFTVSAFRRSDGWRVYVSGFAFAFHWRAGRRVSFRN